jgi:signal peptidase I
MQRFGETFGFAALLNLLLPGAGHVFWRDYLFGVFVFLIALLSATLFFFSLIFPLPPVVKLVLFGLPTLFYLATFLDLRKTLRKRGPRVRRSPRLVLVFLGLGLAAQFLAPLAPGNFALRNLPSIYTVTGNSLAPLLRDGDLAMADASHYYLHVFFVDHPIWRRQPDLGAIVRFADDNGRNRSGIVVGRPGERVEIDDGLLYVNGVSVPDAFDHRLHLSGDIPLTVAQPGSILVATLKTGAVDEVYQVYGDRVAGKVYRLF